MKLIQQKIHRKINERASMAEWNKLVNKLYIFGNV